MGDGHARGHRALSKLETVVILAVHEEIPRENLEEMILDKGETMIKVEGVGKHRGGLTGVEIRMVMALDPLQMIQGEVVEVRRIRQLPEQVRSSIF